MPARFSYKNDSDEDRANPQKEAARRLQEQEQQSGSEYASSGIDQLESFANDPSNHNDTQSVREAEDEPAGGWKSNVTGGGDKKTPFTAKAKMFFKKRGALVTILGAFGIGGGLLAGFAGPSSMLIALTQNLYNQNDSSSTSIHSRFMNPFGYMTANSDPICAGKTTNSLKCKMGKISNSALKSLKEKGITAIPDTSGKNGYPDKNPTSYKIEVGDINKTIPASEMRSFLGDNPKVAAKVLGAGGAFNVRVTSWASRYMKEKLYDKVGIKRNGGLADGENKATSASERFNNITKKLEESIPGFKTDGAVSNIKEKALGKVKESKRAGVGYTLAVASCIAPKAPSIVAAGIAGVQLAQVLPIIDTVVMSPGEKSMISGLDKDAKYTGDDMSSIGSLMTERVKGSDGTTGSALDSPILNAAMGVNKGKPAISTKYTPGYSALTNPIVKESKIVDKNLEPACNIIMSPAAMYSAMAVDAATTIALNSTVIGGIIKVGASVLVQYAAQQAVEKYVGVIAENVLNDVAKNDNIAKAKGKDLGDVLGVSALSYFSAGGMAHNLPTLKKSQLSQFVAMQKETQDEDRQMDVASLSPFDISSQYTFLGSIVHGFGTASIETGANTGGIFSQIMGYLRTPLASLTNTASAADFSEASCGYAGDFGLEADNDQNTPAINAAGMPCTGITNEQASMSTETAISLMVNQGWIDESKSVPDDASISDLMTSEYIVPDKPLANYITDCGDATTGDYLFNAAGCSIDGSTKDPTTVKSNSCGGTCVGDTSDFGPSGNGTSAEVSAQALAAMPVFLLDYQIHQSINGEDDPYTGGSAPSSAAGATIDQDHIYEDSTSIACATGTTDAGVEQGYYNGKEVDVRLCTIPNTIDNGPDGNGGLIRVNSRVSGAFLAMTQAFISSGQNPYGDKVRFADSYRSMAAQQQVYAQYGSPRAAAPGYSNHQMGLAVDIQLQSNNGATRPGDPTYDWLVANAKKWGLTKLTTESWHWQPQAAQMSAVL